MVICGQNASYVTGSAPYSVAKIIVVAMCVVAALMVAFAAIAAG